LARGCGAIFLKDTTASEIKTPKKKPLAAGAWEPGIPKHNVNSTKSSKSIGKYTFDVCQNEKANKVL